MVAWRNVIGAVLMLGFAVSATGCDYTWRGLMQDTGENLEKTGEALERVGEKVQGKDEPQ